VVVEAAEEAALVVPDEDEDEEDEDEEDEEDEEEEEVEPDVEVLVVAVLVVDEVVVVDAFPLEPRPTARTP